ncbi:hypothetical protein C9I50_14845 [Pseudomonas prosekii]|nr:hypothetical protein C9I50_14845 [Pseudomonas prosekii]
MRKSVVRMLPFIAKDRQPIMRATLQIRRIALVASELLRQIGCCGQRACLPLLISKPAFEDLRFH